MLVKFWGVHGSLPRPGPTTLKFGGNTACVEVRLSKVLIIFDAGSGIRELGEDIQRRNQSGPRERGKIEAYIFFSHLHWDHVQGFPFFDPAFQKGNEFHLYGGHGLRRTIQRIMRDQMAQPNFPVTINDMASYIDFHDLEPGESVKIEDAVIRAELLNHPGGSFGYRLERGGKVLVYASDTEYADETDCSVVDLARGADVLIYDGMFTPEQYLGLADGIKRHRWGHSTWEGAVATALAAGVKQLILFHHGNDDKTVEDIQLKAKANFPETIAAYEGLEMEI